MRRFCQMNSKGWRIRRTDLLPNHFQLKVKGPLDDWELTIMKRIWSPLDRPQSLFEFVPQTYHSHAGSTNPCWIIWTDLIPFASSLAELNRLWRGLRWLAIGDMRWLLARKRGLSRGVGGKRGLSSRRSLRVTNFPAVKPHLRPSSTLRGPTVIPNNNDHHRHPRPCNIIIIITLSYLLPLNDVVSWTEDHLNNFFLCNLLSHYSLICCSYWI